MTRLSQELPVLLDQTGATPGRRENSPASRPYYAIGAGMKSRAAVLFEQPGKWQVIDIDVEPPRQGELVVRMAAAGLCHSDDHLATGDMPFTGALPLVGGH